MSGLPPYANMHLLLSAECSSIRLPRPPARIRAFTCRSMSFSQPVVLLPGQLHTSRQKPVLRLDAQGVNDLVVLIDQLVSRREADVLDDGNVEIYVECRLVSQVAIKKLHVAAALR